MDDRGLGSFFRETPYLSSLEDKEAEQCKNQLVKDICASPAWC